MDDEKVKGDGSDWEPYAHQKLKFGKKGQKLVGINEFWMVWIRFENIQSDSPKMLKGQS